MHREALEALETQALSAEHSYATGATDMSHAAEPAEHTQTPAAKEEL